MAKNTEKKSQRIAADVAQAVNAGKCGVLETVDFSDPERPKTCLEVDFPILPINRIASIEQNVTKPVYQVSKWWARRRSSVFRSMLLAAAAKAPSNPAETAKIISDSYYWNHQSNDSFSDLKVADIFMGGGTTIIEGSRLGMRMYGADINPIAWFVVKNELVNIEVDEVDKLLDDVEAALKPFIMPLYACDCPRGHKGVWRRKSTNEIMGDNFDPLVLSPDERIDYSYEGPEIICVFWAKHGPCQVTGCGHRTPIMSSSVIATKNLSVRFWSYNCSNCQSSFDIEEKDARIAPRANFVVAEDEKPYVLLAEDRSVTCPTCGHRESFPQSVHKGKNKSVSLTLLVHPDWLKGESKFQSNGVEYGGTPTDNAESTVAWNRVRAQAMSIVEVRGNLPDCIICPDTGMTISTGKAGGTVPERSKFSCGSCGTLQDVLTTIKSTEKAAPVAAYVIQGYCPACDVEKQVYRGRFFMSVNDSRPFDTAEKEWEKRRESDLSEWWPQSEIPDGYRTHVRDGIHNFGFTHWYTMFNSRQLLVHAQLLKSIVSVGTHEWSTREFVLTAFQQYLRNQNMFTIWNIQRDTLEPMFANPNYYPKATVVENCVFPKLGRGNWNSCAKSLKSLLEWIKNPWELASTEKLLELIPNLSEDLSGKSQKIYSGDPPQVDEAVAIECRSATKLTNIEKESYDLVITDPPFGDLIHYAELANFFYVWLRLPLKEKYPNHFQSEYTPQALEVIVDRARNSDNPDEFYQRLLTECWGEAHRILKPGGLLAFTFHHSRDEPWVAVLESLFEAGFYLEATYPIRSDEMKGDGAFGSKKIEYDIVHVCRKLRERPKRISWARIRQMILADVRQLRELLEHHKNEGLPEADLQVIRRGKALEYYSRHYGEVYVDENKPMPVKDALLGINQILDEDSGIISDPPPANTEPFTWQFLRLFSGRSEMPQDEMHKYLRGTGISPDDFEYKGWCWNERKVYHLVSPMQIAQEWRGKLRRGMTNDYDQAMFLIGACFDNSGINAIETLNNDNFNPHPALESLIVWFSTRGVTTEIRNAAIRAGIILNGWKSRNPQKSRQIDLFFEEGDK